MGLLSFDPEQLKVFFLILIRVSVVLFMFPIFGGNMLPTSVKAGFSMILSIVFFPVITIDPALFPSHPVQFLTLAVSELVIGLCLGMTVRLFFAGVQLAGQMVGFQMGFAIINVMDPQTGSQVSIIDQIGYWVVLLVFLALNGHHTMITALGESFQLVDVGMVSINSALLSQMVKMSSDIFVVAIKIGAPAIAALLFTSAAFGISAKFAPQMNILIAAFPIKIIVGLTFFGVCLRIIASMTQVFLVSFQPLLTTILSRLGGG
jgi:flagellar biosynthesis protein FliR